MLQQDALWFLFMTLYLFQSWNICESMLLKSHIYLVSVENSQFAIFQGNVSMYAVFYFFNLD